MMADTSSRDEEVEGLDKCHSDEANSEDERLDEEEEEEELDPRVQGELEMLNSASDEINTLERELEKSRNKFRATLAESTHHLNALFKKLGKAVLKARPYYELLKNSREAQTEAQKAAVNFQRSNSVYQAAKEMVQLAEERNFPEDGDKRSFDSAWQEMLNHATIKFTESEKEKAASEQNHLKRAAEYAAIQQKLRFHEKDMPRMIKKAKPYFDLKDKLERHLQMERVNVEDLQMGLVCAKHKYRSALTNLEAISEDIHQKRKKRLNLPARTPGVGAESISDLSSLPSYTLDNLSDNISFMSMEDLDADGASLKDEIAEFERTHFPDAQSTSSNISEKPVEVSKTITSGIGDREPVAEGSESSETFEDRPTPSSQHSEVITYKSTVSIGPLVTPPKAHQPVLKGFGPDRSTSSPRGAAVAISGDSEADAFRKAEAVNRSSAPTRNQRSTRKQQTHMAFPILQGLKSTQGTMATQYTERYGPSANMYPRIPSPYVNAPPQKPSQGAAVAMEDPDTSSKEKSKKKQEVFV